MYLCIRKISCSAEKVNRTKHNQLQRQIQNTNDWAIFPHTTEVGVFFLRGAVKHLFLKNFVFVVAPQIVSVFQLQYIGTVLIMLT